MGPSWIGWNLCSINCGNTAICKFMSGQLLLHPTKSVNIFIKIYNKNVQSAPVVQVISFAFDIGT